MEATEKPKRASPEKTIFGILAGELKREFASPRREEAILTMIKYLTLFFRDIGRPQKWIVERKQTANINRKQKKRESRAYVPKQATKLVDAILELCKIERSSELAFWAVEGLAEINATLNGDLIPCLIERELIWSFRDLVSMASKHLENLLVTGETDSIRSVTRFAGKVLSSGSPFEDELNNIRSSSLTKLPEASRRFLMPEGALDTTRLVQITDPSQSVEVRQLAYLLQTSWMRHHERKLDSATFDSLRAFGKGFKNLDFVGSFGEEVRFSDEYFGGEAYRAGETVIVQMPAVVWRLGSRLRVIAKGIVKPKS